MSTRRYLNFNDLGIKNKTDLITFLIGLPAFGALMYVNFFSRAEPLVERSGIVGLALVVLFLRYPITRKNKTLRWVVDLGHIALTIFCYGYIWWDGSAIVFYRIGGATNLLDKLIYLPTVYLIFEGTRRATGWAFTLVATGLLLYGHIGHLIPGVLTHSRLPFDLLAEIVVLNVDGIFGATTHAHISMIWFFLIFGVFLTVTGAGSGFIDFAFSLVGTKRGGAGQAAVVSSLLYGTVSGSGVASVASMGTFTIPLMKNAGFLPHIAGGIEAATAMGAQVTPPVLGGTAFLISALTGIAYITLVKVCVPISLVYYFCLFLFIYFESGKLGLLGLPREQVPKLDRGIVLRAVIPLTAIIVMIVLLIWGYTPRMAGLAATIWVFLLSITQKKIGMKMNPAVFLRGIAEGFNSGVSLMAILATAGACVALVNTTGLGIKFSSLIAQLGGQYLLLAVILVMIAALILGMGLPTPAAYCILAILCGPALVKLGMSVLSAHMLIFYYAVFAGLTPPVGIAFMTAASIANSKQIQTGLAAVRAAIVGLIAPLVWTFKPELIFLEKGLSIQVWTTSTFAIGVTALVLAFVGYSINKHVNTPLRILFFALGIGILFTGFTYQVILLIGYGIIFYLHHFGFTLEPIRIRTSLGQRKNYT